MPYTRGPYFFSKIDSIYAEKDGACVRIAKIDLQSGLFTDELMANGFLLATAPDLLKACKAVLDSEVIVSGMVYSMLKNAIDRAEGK